MLKVASDELPAADDVGKASLDPNIVGADGNVSPTTGFGSVAVGGVE